MLLVLTYLLTHLQIHLLTGVTYSEAYLLTYLLVAFSGLCRAPKLGVQVIDSVLDPRKCTDFPISYTFAGFHGPKRNEPRGDGRRIAN